MKRKMGKWAVAALGFAALWTFGFAGQSCAEETCSAAYNEVVFADWEKQEAHVGRNCSNVNAMRELYRRATLLYNDLTGNDLISEEAAQAFDAALTEARGFNPKGASPDEILNAYRSLRLAMREAIFQNELLRDKPVVFLKGNRFGFQILQDYLSYYMRFSNIHGGGLYVLKNPGKSFETIDLTADFPMGQFATPNLSADAKTLYFSYADFSKVMDPNAPRKTAIELQQEGDPGLPEQPGRLGDFLKDPEGKFHVFRMNLADGEYEQLTEGPYDDFCAAPLPDGGVVFTSTRRGSFARCNGGWEPIMTATLHRWDEGGAIKTLSWHETNEWTPQVVNDGRICYCRWDYVDRAASRYQGLWLTNPDGTGAVSLFGSYTEDVCVCIQPRQVPNSNKIMFLAAAHHLGIGGSIVMLDPTKVKYDTETGFDRLDSIEKITPEIPFPETSQPNEPNPVCTPDHYYYSPYPLSEDYYLTAYSHEHMGGYLPTHGALTPETVWHGILGVYYRDRFGNLELLYEDPEFECRDPLLVDETALPPVIAPQTVDNGEENATGTFSLSNVYESLLPMPEGRKVKELRIFQILPKFPTHAGDNPKVGHDFAGNARLLLGTVPVEEDGSAHFTAPARKPLYFQAVDESGRAVQTMLSEVYLQPGENRGCVGCHEQAQTTADNVDQHRTAFLRLASEITPGPDGTKPFGYVRLVQPILDRSCVSCHGGNENDPAPALTGEPSGTFTTSYNTLMPYLRWYDWAEVAIRRTVSFPGECGADASRLSQIIDDENHKGINLSDEDRRNLYLWLDANIPFAGTYDYGEYAKQRSGEAIPVQDFQ